MMLDPKIYSKAVQQECTLKVQFASNDFNSETAINSPKDKSISAMYASNANLEAYCTRDQDSIHTVSLGE